MRIAGEWLRGNDGVARPVLRLGVHGADGRFYDAAFLIDTGADRTVLSAFLLRSLRLPAERSSSGEVLEGIGGAAASVVVVTALELTTDDGRPVTIRGEFAAFIDLQATDLSILGRDVLDTFDVIISHRRDEVLLLAQYHGYTVVRM